MHGFFFLISMKLSLSIFSFVHMPWYDFKKPLPNLKSEIPVPLVPSKHFIVLVLRFESLIHLELIFVYYVR